MTHSYGHVDVSQLKLGKLPRKIDQRTLRGASFIDLKLAVPPEEVDYRSGITDWQMYGNDVEGDCTCAAVGHMRKVWSKIATGTEVSDTDADILTAYHHFSPPPADTGAVELDVLNYWRQVGIGGEKIVAYVALPVSQQLLVKTAMWLLGGLYVGAELPLSAQSQVGGVWDVVAGPDAQAGSWGGHAFNVVRLDSKGGTGITWAREQEFTWAWWSAYITEDYGVLPSEWEAFVTRLSPSGQNFAQLAADVAGGL